MALGIGIPLAVTAVFFTFKANAAVLYFIACASALLFDRGTEGIEKILGSTVPGSPQLTDYIVAVLLVLPLIIGLLILSRNGKKWLLTQLVPSLLCGIIIYLTTVRVALYLFDTDWRNGFIWNLFTAREDLLISLGTFTCLILMSFGGKSGGHHESKHGKH